MADEHNKFEAAIDAAVSVGRFPGPELLVWADLLDEQNTAEDALLADSNRRIVEGHNRPKTVEHLDAEVFVMELLVKLRRGRG